MLNCSGHVGADRKKDGRHGINTCVRFGTNDQVPIVSWIVCGYVGTRTDLKVVFYSVTPHSTLHTPHRHAISAGRTASTLGPCRADYARLCDSGYEAVSATEAMDRW